MRLHALLLFFTLASANALYAQSITGRIIDENQNPIPYANVALFSESDSSLVAGAVSDDTGAFSIAAQPGNYYLRITFLSYEEAIASDIVVAGGIADVGIIQLKIGSKVLEAVTIQGEKSQMELYLDKRVFQVGKDLSNISGSAAEILDNVPSVTVDVDGNISLRGSPNVRILIDGRPSGLTGISTADALRQLQGNLIERIEVITNPSARYDAEGEVGILNIILKKEKSKGVNGSFMVNAGYPDNYGASFNMNMRKKSFNFFSTYGFSYRSSPGSGSSFQTFQQADTSFSYRQQNNQVRSDRSHNIRAGLDYYFNDRNILTGSFVIRKSDGLNNATNNYLDYDGDGNLFREIVREEVEEEPELNSEVDLTYRRTYDRQGRELTANFKWIENREIESARFTQTDRSIDSIGFQRSSNTENERNALAQLDYVHPFSEKGKIETGLKSTLRVIDNDFLVEQRNAEGSDWFTLPDFNNNLVYTENIHAAYVIIGNELNRFSWQAGARGELSDIIVELVESDKKTYQNYFNLFPSAHLSYRFTDDKTIQLSYSYRISRPGFRSLMPFSGYSDNRSLNIGNPQLRPEYTHSMEAGYLLNWDEGSLLSSTYYRYRTGVITRIPVVGEDGITQSFPVNLSTEDAYGFEFNVSWNPVKWWRFNSNANFYRAITEGKYNEELFFSDTYTWTNRTTSRLTLFRKWDFQQGFSYRAPRNVPQGRERSIYFIDLGLSHDVLKGNGTLTFAVRDLLNSRRFRSVIERPDEGYYSERNFQRRVRQFTMTFTYRLNRKKEQAQRERDDEGMDD